MARRTSLIGVQRRSSQVPDATAESLNALGIGSRLSIFRERGPPGSSVISAQGRSTLRGSSATRSSYAASMDMSMYRPAASASTPSPSLPDPPKDFKYGKFDMTFHDLLWQLGQQHEAQLSAVVSELESLRTRINRGAYQGSSDDDPSATSSMDLYTTLAGADGQWPTGVRHAGSSQFQVELHGSLASLASRTSKESIDTGQSSEQNGIAKKSADRDSTTLTPGSAEETLEHITNRPRETVPRSPGLNPGLVLKRSEGDSSVLANQLVTKSQSVMFVDAAKGPDPASMDIKTIAPVGDTSSKMNGNHSSEHAVHPPYLQDALGRCGLDRGIGTNSEEQALAIKPSKDSGGSETNHRQSLETIETTVTALTHMERATTLNKLRASRARAYKKAAQLMSNIWGTGSNETRGRGMRGSTGAEPRRTQIDRDEGCCSSCSVCGPTPVGDRTICCAAVYWLVKNSWFESIFAVVILANAVFIGAEVEYLAHGDINASTTNMFEVAHHVFSALFLMELCMRLAADRLFFFTSKENMWNIFDLALVVHSLVEYIMSFDDSSEEDSGEGRFNQISAQRTLRVVRIIRNVRIVRVLRLFHELRMMLYAIFGCVKALLWLIVLLLLLLYFFAVFFTQGATEYQKEHHKSKTTSSYGEEDARKSSEVRDKYGSLPISMFSLYKGMTNGISWGELVWPLEYMHWFYILLFLVFISFTIFAVLNVVTGVFVDSALQQTHNEEENRAREEEYAKVANMRRIKELFHEIDADESGTVSFEEFSEALEDEYVRKCFEVLQINIFEAEQLFHLLDPESQGQVQIDEFVKGCMRLKGEAKSIDIAVLIYESRRMMHRLKMFMLFVVEQFENMSDKKCWHTHPPDLGLIRFSSDHFAEHLTRGSITGDDIVRNLRADDNENSVHYNDSSDPEPMTKVESTKSNQSNAMTKLSSIRSNRSNAGKELEWKAESSKEGWQTQGKLPAVQEARSDKYGSSHDEQEDDSHGQSHGHSHDGHSHSHGHSH